MIQNLNNKIQNVIDIWNKLDFTKLSSITEKGNIIIFHILTYESKSYVFLEQFNKLLKTKHPYGDLIFYGYKSIELKDDYNTTSLKKYKAIVNVEEKNFNSEEYIKKSEIFYENLYKILENLK